MEEIFNDISSIDKKENSRIFNYLLDKISKSKPYDEDTKDLINNLKNAQDDFETAVTNYEFAEEPELIDYYTYKIKATQTRYQYLLKKAKERGL